MLSLKKSISIVSAAGGGVIIYYMVFHAFLPNRFQSAMKQYMEVYHSMLDISNLLDPHDQESDDVFASISRELLARSIDSFSGRQYRFVVGKEAGRRVWFLISTGPDRDFDFDEACCSWVAYDPTNGTLSTGDIVFGSRFNPKRYDIGPLPSRLGRLKGDPARNPQLWQQSQYGYEYVGN